MSTTIEQQDPSFLADDSFSGWKAVTMRNAWVTMHLTPQLGGRIIQVKLGEYPYLFNNPNLIGQVPDEDDTGKKGAWLNFGGEKIWPAPQGWGSPDLWPGPPDPVLDGGPYKIVSDVSAGTGLPSSVSLMSSPDPYTGLQISKEISLSKDRSAISVRASFFNKSAVERNWSIWPVLQLDTIGGQAAGPYLVSCPVYQESHFPEGYKVMHGLVNNPQYRCDGYHNLLIDYQYIVGKVGLDSRANWVSFVNQRTGHVLIAAFEFQEHAIYPENTSVQIWTQGQGQVYSRNEIRDYANDPEVNWPYLEIELLSPLYHIKPGEKVSFDYQLICCKIMPGTYVIRKTNWGVVSSPLKIRREGHLLTFSGQYGVFAKGELRLELFNMQQYRILPAVCSCPADPLKGISLHAAIDWEEIRNYPGVFINVSFYTEAGDFAELIDQCTYAIS